MKRMWNNLLMDKAGDGTGGGGVSGGGAPAAGTNSFITPDGQAGKAAPKEGDAGTPPGGTGAAPASTTNPPAGNAPTDWRSGLPAELQEDASLKKFTSVHALAGAYINAQKLIGGDKIPVPNKHTTEADWKEIYKKLGVPEKVDEYQIKFKDGVPVDEEFSKQFVSQAHTLGILPKQAQALADWFSDSIVQGDQKSQQKANEHFEQQKAVLTKEWGNSFELQINRANKVAKELGGAEFVDYLNNTGMGANATVMKFLAKIGENMYKEHKFVEGEGTSSTMSPKQLDSEIAKLQSHPAYMDKLHPQHKAIVDEITGLYQKRYQK